MDMTDQSAILTAVLVVIVSALVLSSVKVRRALATWMARFRLYRLQRQQNERGDDAPTVSGVYIYPVKSLRAVSLESSELDLLGFVGDRRFMLVAPSPQRMGGSFYFVKKSHRFVTQRQCPWLATMDAFTRRGKLILSCSKTEKSVVLDVRPRALERNPIYHAGIWDDVVEVVDVGDKAADFIQSVADATEDNNASLVVPGIRLVAMKAPKPVNDAYVPPAARTALGETPTTALNDGFPLLIACEASLHELNSKLNGKGKEPIPMSRFRPNIVIKNTKPFEEDNWKAIRIGNKDNSTILHVVKGCPRCKQSCTDQLSGQVSDEPLATLADFRALGRSKEDVYFAQNAMPQITGNEKQEISVGDSVTVLTRGDPVWDKEQVQAE